MADKNAFDVVAAELLTCVPTLALCPDLNNLPETVFLGRSNVGKSSVINALAKRKKLAFTSNTPGKTRLIHYYQLQLRNREEPVIFVDLPGYGYAKISKSEQERWQKDLSRFFTERTPIARALLLIDARHGPQNNDVQMFSWWMAHPTLQERPLHIVLTKTDKIGRGAVGQVKAHTSDVLSVSPALIHPVSAETGEGIPALWQAILGD
jgi:GTP-binding protein